MLKNAIARVKRFIAADLSVSSRPKLFLNNGLDTPTKITQFHHFGVLLWISSWIYRNAFKSTSGSLNIGEDGVGTRVWSGASKPGWPNLNLLLHEDHFCYIINMDSFVHNFRREQCGP